MALTLHTARRWRGQYRKARNRRFHPACERLEVIQLLSSFSIDKDNMGYTLYGNPDGTNVHGDGGGDDYLGAGSSSNLESRRSL